MILQTSSILFWGLFPFLSLLVNFSVSVKTCLCQPLMDRMIIFWWLPGPPWYSKLLSDVVARLKSYKVNEYIWLSTSISEELLWARHTQVLSHIIMDLGNLDSFLKSDICIWVYFKYNNRLGRHFNLPRMPFVILYVPIHLTIQSCTTSPRLFFLYSLDVCIYSIPWRCQAIFSHRSCTYSFFPFLKCYLTTPTVLSTSLSLPWIQVSA